MSEQQADERSIGKRANELNATIRYTMWSVFRAASPLPAMRQELAGEVDALFEQLAGKDVTIRGTYDVSGLRADADLMVWWHSASPDALQDAYGLFRRTALGRAGEEEKLQRDDRTLTAIAHAELGELVGVPLPSPVDSWVQRWGGGLPQYAPGHLDRVAAARAALAGRPGLGLAGAAYDGVGIPACVASGERAAEDVCKILED